MDSESVSSWIRQLGQGNQTAASRLWERYGPALERLARSRYGPALNATFDEQDLAQSVFFALWKNAEAGGLDEIRDRSELWWLLLKLIHRRACSRLRYNQAQKRSGEVSAQTLVQSSSGALDPLGQFANPRDLPPELIVVLSDEHERLMGLLRNDQLREIAGMKLEGYLVEEIAEKLGISVRSVIRKLNLIREQWDQELLND